MLDPKSAEIFIDIDSIDYLIGSNEKYDYDETDIVKLASLGYHGTIDIFRPGMFWEDFIEAVPKLLVHFVLYFLISDKFLTKKKVLMLKVLLNMKRLVMP